MKLLNYKKMRKKINLLIHLFIIGLLITTINSCKKDEPLIIKEVVITWANPADIIVGMPLIATQLNATANVPGTFVYTPPIGTVLLLGANQDLTAEFTPRDAKNYKTTTKTVIINVIDKLIPVITWPTPADISLGIALSASQLNATADVPGTFVYTPPAGTVLPLGADQVLRVDFTPTPITHQATSKTVFINVNQKQNPVITWPTPADIYYPTPLGATQLNATTTVPGTFVYTPASGTVLNLGNGQSLRVDFTPDDLSNYNAVYSTVNINVLQLTVTDFDGNVYNTVVIGSLIWTKENLKVTHYRNGDPIPNVTDNAAWAALSSGAYCSYNNLPENFATYGALYNWWAVTDSRNIAPIGWHAATDDDYQALADAYGGNAAAGPSLKEAGTTHWADPNNGTDASGFTALGSGVRGDDGSFSGFNTYGQFWTTLEDASNAAKAWMRSLSNGTSINFPRNSNPKLRGRNVRLVKD